MFMSKKSRAKIDLNFLRPSPCTDKKWKSPLLSALISYRIYNHAINCSSDKFQPLLVVSPAVECCSCLSWYNFVSKGFYGLDLRVKAMAVQTAV